MILCWCTQSVRYHSQRSELLNFCDCFDLVFGSSSLRRFVTSLHFSCRLHALRRAGCHLSPVTCHLSPWRMPTLVDISRRRTTMNFVVSSREITCVELSKLLTEMGHATVFEMTLPLLRLTCTQLQRSTMLEPNNTMVCQHAASLAGYVWKHPFSPSEKNYKKFQASAKVLFIYLSNARSTRSITTHEKRKHNAKISALTIDERSIRNAIVSQTHGGFFVHAPTVVVCSSLRYTIRGRIQGTEPWPQLALSQHR